MEKCYVNVRFFDNYDRSKLAEKEYCFIAWENLATGDLVVVETKFGLSLAVVSGNLPIKPNQLSDRDMREVVTKVVTKVDTSAFEMRKAKAERKAELKRLMDQRIKGLEEIDRYEAFAKEDEALKTMLDAYKELNQ